MKKNKLIAIIAIILILATLSFMVFDFFWKKKTKKKNPFKYNIENLEHIDKKHIKYKEIDNFAINIEQLKAIVIDKNNDKKYISGKDKILIYDKNNILENEFLTNKHASCITLSPDNEIYVGVHDHLEIWDTLGNQLQSWAVLNQYVTITSIAVNDSSVFVADAGNKIVYHYNRNGELQNEIGRKDTAQGILGFFIPSPYFDLAFGWNNELWVANTGRHSFESYTPEGKLIASWKRRSMELEGFSGCCNPSHFAVLSDGSYVTSEKGLVRIKIHKPSGDFKCVVATPEQFEKKTRGLDVAVDSHDNIFVLDPVKKMIRIFELIDK